MPGSTGPAATPREPERVETGAIPEVQVETVRSVIRARRLRGRFFAEDLFADPAWDMLLDLLQAELAQLRVPVSSPASRSATLGARLITGSS